MRITLEIDDVLYEKARKLAEPSISMDEFFQMVLQTFVHVKSAQRLSDVGLKTTEPDSVTLSRSDAGNK